MQHGPERCLVIGGGTGIGLACAQAVVAAGGSVCLSGRRGAVLSAAAEGLAAAGRVFTAPGDAADAADMARVVAQAVAALGGLDAVVISAGVSGRTPVPGTAPDLFQSIIDGNLRPVFLAAELAAPHLIATGGGAIVAISSIYGLVGQRERAAYCAAKAGVIGMVRALALDLAAVGVRVNAVCPGFVETPLALATAAQEADPAAAIAARRAMHPIPRAARPEEVAALVLHLCSPQAAFLTGAALPIDGGYTAR